MVDVRRTCFPLHVHSQPLDYGAAVGEVDIGGDTPLHFACCRDTLDIEVCRLLLEFGADSKEKNARGESPYQIAVNREAKI